LRRTQLCPGPSEPFSAAWWRAALPAECRPFFDATLVLIEPIAPGFDPRLADVARLALLSAAIVESERALDFTPPDQCAELSRQLRTTRKKRAALAAELGLVWS
jgi:hypothetical protein